MFFCEFCKIFKNIFSFDRAPPADCFLCLSVNFETFFRDTSFIEYLWETAILCIRCRISTTRYSKKNYFTGAFQAFHTRSRKSHSKVFTYLKSLKTVCKEVNLLWSCETATRSFMKKSLSHILRHVFCLRFLRMHLDYFFWRGLGSVRAQFLPRNVDGK